MQSGKYCSVLLATAKPRHVHYIARQRSVICLHLTLCIALGDVRLGCSCSAMETHSMNFCMRCCSANLKATPSSEVFSY
ncbi:unnamed protein product [Staurois parvus]|uniref:Uncharacterized protein n=1 Tax=Staurois parvus TaxID=386267 RepID=A0ABN9D6H6_9NEOB|nr:unnamed protein product [Staurois parvus]